MPFKNIRVPLSDVSTWKRLRMLALERGMTLQTIVAAAISEYIDRHK